MAAVAPVATSSSTAGPWWQSAELHGGTQQQGSEGAATGRRGWRSWRVGGRAHRRWCSSASAGKRADGGASRKSMAAAAWGSTAAVGRGDAAAQPRWSATAKSGDKPSLCMHGRRKTDSWIRLRRTRGGTHYVFCQDEDPRRSARRNRTMETRHPPDIQ